MDGIPHWLERTELLLGSETLQRLADKHILVVGLGGVGSKACELLARSGIGRFTLVDHDKVDETNINRQVIAFRDTIGRPKVEVVETDPYRNWVLVAIRHENDLTILMEIKLGT